MAASAVSIAARHSGAVVPPNPRGVHTRPMVSLGGAGMFVGFVVALAVASQVPQYREMFNGSSEPLGVLISADQQIGKAYT